MFVYSIFLDFFFRCYPSQRIILLSRILTFFFLVLIYKVPALAHSLHLYGTAKKRREVVYVQMYVYSRVTLFNNVKWYGEGFLDLRIHVLAHAMIRSIRIFLNSLVLDCSGITTRTFSTLGSSAFEDNRAWYYIISGVYVCSLNSYFETHFVLVKLPTRVIRSRNCRSFRCETLLFLGFASNLFKSFPV